MQRLLSAALVAGLLASPASAELFISEYVEGSSNNKAIEVYNPGPGPINTANYFINMYFNGNVSAGTTVALTGHSIPQGGVLVVAHSSADAAILAEADITTGSSFFNGDDAVELVHFASPVDVIGQIGFDPGSEWSGACGGTQNETIRRNASVCAGDTNGADAFDLCVNGFTAFPQDTFDGLGSHTANCGTTGTEEASWGTVKDLFR